jgi:acetyltransferase-like isoleucine patch superfamily enzyme
VDYRRLFKSCGDNVEIAEDAYFEHPELLDVGDNVRFMRSFYMIGSPQICRIGSHVSFYPNFFHQGSAGRIIIGDHIDFYPNTYISSGGARGFVEIGHHSHFAPGCVLYGAGGLSIGPYCNIAAHVVFATTGHDDAVHEQPMSLAPSKGGPITLVEDIWIAANATVTANTTIARGCIIGANAVVTRNTEPMGLYVGVPARRLRNRNLASDRGAE